jgi:hypothetical protein
VTKVEVFYPFYKKTEQSDTKTLGTLAHFRDCPITPKIQNNSSPLMGEVKVGVIKLGMESASYLLTLPLIPSHQGRGKELLDSL